jgi:hypothetical protein
MSQITRRPPVSSSLVAGAAAVVTVPIAGLGSTTGLAFAAIGFVVFAVGLWWSHRRAIDAGSVALFFGVVVGGIGTTVVEPTVVGTITTILAWDIAHGAVDLGEQLGREAETTRLEAVHVISSSLVGLLSGTVGYAIYVVAGGQPVAAAVLLVLAALLIIVGFGSRPAGSVRRRR